MSYEYRRYLGRIPPGRIESKIKHPGFGMSKRFSIEIAFQDAGDRVWIKTYPTTLLYWLAVRRRYLWMKVRDRELRQILSCIEKEF